jgi:hypothetical membrane protein
MSAGCYGETMRDIGKPALIAAIVGPIQSVTGWMLAGSLFAGYDPVRMTISDLAAVESPTHLLQSSFFILGGTLTIIAAIFARTFSMPGRVALFVAGLCTYGLTIFPTPLNGSSDLHRIFAIASFVLSAGWPLFAMRFRKDAPWLIRPLFSIIGTIFQTVLALIFLAIWADPTATTVGVWERVVATSQVLHISLVIILVYRQQKRRVLEN